MAGDAFVLGNIASNRPKKSALTSVLLLARLEIGQNSASLAEIED